MLLCPSRLASHETAALRTALLAPVLTNDAQRYPSRQLFGRCLRTASRDMFCRSRHKISRLLPSWRERLWYALDLRLPTPGLVAWLVFRQPTEAALVQSVWTGMAKRRIVVAVRSHSVTVNPQAAAGKDAPTQQGAVGITKGILIGAFPSAEKGLQEKMNPLLISPELFEELVPQGDVT